MAINSFGQFSNASGNNSLIAIQIIAHAANHNPTGRNGANCCTKRNAGTAIITCGKLEKTLRQAACHQVYHLGTSTVLIANHSGILCNAIASAMNIQNDSLGQNDTHTAIPSVNECKVIIQMINNTFLASAHLRWWTLMLSYFDSTLSQ